MTSTTEPAVAPAAVAAEKNGAPPKLDVAAVGAKKEESPVNDGIDEVNPADFAGEVATSNELPSDATLKRVEDYVLLDKHGKSHTFKSLYSGKGVARRVMIIFVRHFLCGNCREYLRLLSETISTDALLRLPVSTFIAVVGCGDPNAIDFYARSTGCPFPIYTDPSRKLYAELGMVSTLDLGRRPAYTRKGLLMNSLESVAQGLLNIGSGLIAGTAAARQVGGEFLFEPLTVSTPTDEEDRTIGARSLTGMSAAGAEEEHAAAAAADGRGGGGATEEKKVTWCHRMRTTRGHAEIPELMKVLGLDEKGQPIEGRQLWSEVACGGCKLWLLESTCTHVSLPTGPDLIFIQAKREEEKEEKAKK
ncbi:uncharacterized protein E0L32_005384 [Thyridium curvatum]|uniref:Thioredoxin-like protein AAED1 n=1 Tax=Thyridium curvatum TaxID=1093900 RepID=A0A507BCW5_9PEZI|nr:uncharacterized protein E0L32_005384 [Thyridium curvatum]TPX14420.1 hypothetical protein E0L32_005384 [Thyridium curvatum]